MLHLLGVNLPDHKKVPVALSRFYGIGFHVGSKICHQLSIHPYCKLGELTPDQINKLGSLLNTMTLEGDLKREIKNRILHHVQLNTVKGIKFKIGLPVRGQRVRTNAKTAEKLNKQWLTKQFSTYRSSSELSALHPGMLLSRHLPIMNKALQIVKRW